MQQQRIEALNLLEIETLYQLRCLRASFDEVGLELVALRKGYYHYIIYCYSVHYLQATLF